MLLAFVDIVKAIKMTVRCDISIFMAFKKFTIITQTVKR